MPGELGAIPRSGASPRRDPLAHPARGARPGAQPNDSVAMSDRPAPRSSGDSPPAHSARGAPGPASRYLCALGGCEECRPREELTNNRVLLVPHVVRLTPNVKPRATLLSTRVILAGRRSRPAIPPNDFLKFRARRLQRVVRRHGSGPPAAPPHEADATVDHSSRIARARVRGGRGDALARPSRVP